MAGKGEDMDLERLGYHTTFAQGGLDLGLKRKGRRAALEKELSFGSR